MIFIFQKSVFASMRPNESERWPFVVLETDLIDDLPFGGIAPWSKIVPDKFFLEKNGAEENLYQL